MSNNYIDNEKFFSEIKIWKNEVLKNLEIGEDKPPVTEYIGECFWKIAEHLSFKSNFANYPFKDDMIGDAVFIFYTNNLLCIYTKNRERKETKLY